MRRRPDTLRAVVLLFFIGLAITGLTSLQASEDEPRAVPADISSQGQWFQAQRSQDPRNEG